MDSAGSVHAWTGHATIGESNGDNVSSIDAVQISITAGAGCFHLLPLFICLYITCHFAATGIYGVLIRNRVPATEERFLFWLRGAGQPLLLP